MQVKNQIPPAIIEAAAAMLKPFVHDLSPTRLIAALQGYDSEAKDQEIINARPKQPYTIKEVCDLLRISKPTVYRLMERGDITFIKVGSSTRIPAEDLDRLLNVK